MGSNIHSVSVVLVLIGIVAMVYGHGRLINPPGRSTMWRYGFNTPHNADDHQLSCGGFGVQFYKNGGRCGICGDPYDGPRDNEAGGKYATGTIARQYVQGSVITIQVEVTVNHGGWFEFRLCPNNNVKKAATQECLDRYLLRQVNGQTRYTVPAGLGVASAQLKLPAGLTCSQCVLQWRWNTASNVACDGSQCCRGCGPQEQFYGCADVSVTPGNGGYNQPKFTLSPYVQPKITTQKPNVGVNVPGSFVPINSGGYMPFVPIGAPVNVGKCTATRDYSSPTWDEWCENTCTSGDDCPADICTQECQKLKPEIHIPEEKCKAKEFFRKQQSSREAADRWCLERCSSSVCPLEYCETSCWLK